MKTAIQGKCNSSSLFINMEFEHSETGVMFKMLIASAEDYNSLILTLGGMVSVTDQPNRATVFQLGEIELNTITSTASLNALHKLIADQTLLGLFGGRFIRNFYTEMVSALAVDISAIENRLALIVHDSVMKTLGMPILDTAALKMKGGWFMISKEYVKKCVDNVLIGFEVTTSRKISLTQRTLH